ncbi:uncharacterized protein LOC118753209, partial [Rhagoletis pomonella]|uniref:uncharacterized protein LOC118753209 n=1 Tax=Rhagoletis pomonella TaxID=28610 RepID=UPI00177D144B
VTSSKDGREWILHVKSPQARDSGIYECQVNTEPKMSMAFQLNIIEIPADSRAIISGPADLHFKVGSPIILICHVQQPSIRDIGPIYWYRGDHIITPFELDDDDDDDDEADNNVAHADANADDAEKVESNDNNGRVNAYAEGATLHKRQPSSLANNEVEVDVTATITNVNALAAAGSRSSKGNAGRSRAAMAVAAATAAQHDGLTNDITPDFTARIAMESQLGDTMKSSWVTQ